MSKRVVHTDRAPAPFQGSPYSQAICVGDLVFVSGQVGMVPGATELIGATIEEQTKQALANVEAILVAAGSGLDLLVKTTVFLQDLGDFGAMNEIYRRRVGDQPPARATVQVAKLPNGALIEIEAIAIARPA